MGQRQHGSPEHVLFAGGADHGGSRGERCARVGEGGRASGARPGEELR